MKKIVKYNLIIIDWFCLKLWTLSITIIIVSKNILFIRWVTILSSYTWNQIHGKRDPYEISTSFVRSYCVPSHVSLLTLIFRSTLLDIHGLHFMRWVRLAWLVMSSLFVLSWSTSLHHPPHREKRTFSSSLIIFFIISPRGI